MKVSTIFSNIPFCPDSNKHSPILIRVESYERQNLTAYLAGPRSEIFLHNFPYFFLRENESPPSILIHHLYNILFFLNPFHYKLTWRQLRQLSTTLFFGAKYRFSSKHLVYKSITESKISNSTNSFNLFILQTLSHTFFGSLCDGESSED